MATSSFGRAFAAARKAGKKTFSWNGKKYTTKLASDKPKVKALPKKAPKAKAAPMPKAKPSPKPKAKPKRKLEDGTKVERFSNGRERIGIAGVNSPLGIFIRKRAAGKTSSVSTSDGKSMRKPRANPKAAAKRNASNWVKKKSKNKKSGFLF